MSAPETAPKLLRETRGRVALLTLNRPEIRNAVDADTMNQLREALLAAEADPEIRVVLLTGAGGAFCSGADIKSALQARLTPEKAMQILLESYGPALRCIRALKLPVIAAADGMAAGIGLDLALACDLRLASPQAGFAELFIRVGLIPDGGGTWMLQRLIGQARAKEMIFTGETVDAETALQCGLVNRVLPAVGDAFLQQALAYAAGIAQQSPDALRFGKRAIHEAAAGTYEEALEREAGYQRQIFDGPWGFEGFQAFLEKRKPGWMD
ncbi:MAG: enoyl-CoA hydratase/isomerase family protein [Candidatus Cyclonatronum sp.]|uniref:enoyl-CoA hydratase/isomerase family protein n=1 Tax=Cyclonatronum sp. TaxID=3024185 RepID=UPI0025BFDFD2|nr:enoyl-CoA hydratase-related protein [Cyclonatronum sp.]MCH8487161.1 enoyl-CoA hydratase/isomerase family protein [Cyclonatronum sp.]